MFKKTLIGIVLLALVGCEAGYAEKTRSYQLPQELSHCKVYSLEADVASTARNLTVLHCPRRDNSH